MPDQENLLRFSLVNDFKSTFSVFSYFLKHIYENRAKNQQQRFRN